MNHYDVHLKLIGHLYFNSKQKEIHTQAHVKAIMKEDIFLIGSCKEPQIQTYPISYILDTLGLC